MKKEIQTPKIVLYDKRAVVSYNLGRICAFECKFCYHYQDLGITQFSSKENVNNILKRLDMTSFEIITPGCEQEIFINQKKAIDFIASLSELRKIIALSTRVPLSKKSIESLVTIDKKLKENNNYLTIEFSFISGENRPDLEKRCPQTYKRIETMQNVSKRGIYVIPFIRPILPEEIVKINEIKGLVDKTIKFSESYALGDFYFNDIIKNNMGLNSLGQSFLKNVKSDEKARFFDKENLIWKKYVDKNRKKEIKCYIEQNDEKKAYDSSTKAILHFKKYHQ